MDYTYDQDQIRGVHNRLCCKFSGYVYINEIEVVVYLFLFTQTNSYPTINVSKYLLKE